MIVLHRRRGVIALAATQILGWGSTYFVPAMLVERISADLGLRPTVVFSGVTIMLVVAAFIGTAVGRQVDRDGPRRMLVLGSGLMAVGLSLLGMAEGLAGFVLAWSVMGFGMPMVLIQTPFAAVALLVPGEARRAIGLMTLVGSVTSIVFLPAMAVLEPSLGWRGICFLFSAIEVAICIPLHAAIVVRPIVRDPVDPAGNAEPGGISDPRLRRQAFWTMAVAFSCVGFVTWGLPLHLVEIARAYGQPAAVSVMVGAIMGPAQMVARAAETTFGHRIPILDIGFISLATISVALFLPLLFGGSAVFLFLMVIGYGLGAGANTIVRAIAPLVLFGRAGYATVLGKMGLPMNLVFATAPFVIAAATEAAGPAAGLAVCASATVISFAGMVVLRRIAGTELRQ
jgi:MFS family permease